jgi:hypothetical protein
VERHVHFGWGHGPGLLDFLWDVDLLGKRVAYYLSSENEMGWTALHDLMYERAHRDLEVAGMLAEDDGKWLL